MVNLNLGRATDSVILAPSRTNVTTPCSTFFFFFIILLLSCRVGCFKSDLSPPLAPTSINVKTCSSFTMAIPGVWTTPHFLFPAVWMSFNNQASFWHLTSLAVKRPELRIVSFLSFEVGCVKCHFSIFDLLGKNARGPTMINVKSVQYLRWRILVDQLFVFSRSLDVFQLGSILEFALPAAVKGQMSIEIS